MSVSAGAGVIFWQEKRCLSKASYFFQKKITPAPVLSPQARRLRRSQLQNRPTLINTSVGVAAVSPDLLNVSRVLRLSFWTHVRKVVLPSSVPMIFTGLRVSLGIAWMVLIAAEMLAQSPGLGKFVWDEFQNGSSQSLSRIMVAVLAIGFIGFLLDRVMLLIQKKVAWNE